jgi:hypothetical protein
VNCSGMALPFAASPMATRCSAPSRLLLKPM